MTADTATPLSSRAVIEGTGITYRMLDYWVRVGSIRPSGFGGEHNGYWRLWTERDRFRLEAIGRLSHDLARFGFQCSSAVVRQVWAELETADTCTIERGTVTITVTLDEMAVAS